MSFHAEHDCLESAKPTIINTFITASDFNYQLMYLHIEVS